MPKDGKWTWAPDDFNITMEHISFKFCGNGHKNIVKWALDHGASTVNPRRWVAPVHSGLDYAAENGNEDVVKLLLETQKQRSIRKFEAPFKRCAQRALVNAVQGGWLNIAQLLIDHGACVDGIGRHNDIRLQYCKTFPVPILEAVRCGGQLESVKLLLRNGATVDDKFEYWDSTIQEMIISLAVEHIYSSIQRMFVKGATV